jgi:hypothetical protein
MEDLSCAKLCPAQYSGGINCTLFEREPGADDDPFRSEPIAIFRGEV